jgi:hypothetical protein
MIEYLLKRRTQRLVAFESYTTLVDSQGSLFCELPSQIAYSIAELLMSLTS